MWKNVDQVRKAEGVSRQTIGRWIREGRYENINQVRVVIIAFGWKKTLWFFSMLVSPLLNKTLV